MKRKPSLQIRKTTQVTPKTPPSVGRKTGSMSNPTQNSNSRVAVIPTLIYFLATGSLITLATMLGGVALAVIGGGMIGFFIALTESRAEIAMCTVTGMVAGALTTLAYHAVGEGTTGLIVGPIAFVLCGYVVLIFLAAFFADSGR